MRLFRLAGKYGSLISFLFSVSFAFAGGTGREASVTDQTELRLFSAVTASGDASTLPLGLEMKLKPGWKTYWRSPGDAGFPLQMELTGAENVTGFSMAWPVPHRFELFGLQTFGYGDRVIFPIDLKISEPGKPVRAAFLIRYLVCEKICIPYDAHLELSIPAGKADLTTDAAVLNEFRAQVPQAASGLKIDKVAWEDGSHLRIEASSPLGQFHEPDLLFEASDAILFSKPQVTVKEGGSKAQFLVSVIESDSKARDHAVPLHITLIDEHRGFDQSYANIWALPRGDPSFPFSILLIALLGGLILNAMPCVLPVLILKLASIADLAGRAKSEARQSFLATAAGILFSFAVLAFFILGLKASGQTLGWGIQFQQPLFLGFLVLVCIFFAANLIGIVSIPMPAFLGSLGNVEGRGRWMAPFLTGCLATLLATPCSAPFVGTAIAFALSGNAYSIFLVFMAMGLGLASPYVAVAIFPRIVEKIPRPGRWMKGVKVLLAFSLLGTALWLGTILAGQLGAPFTIVRAKAGAIEWQAFDQDLIHPAVEQGRVVLVDVTADWCITCIANERLVLEQPEVLATLKDVVTMRGDWTKPDEKIAGFLSAHGRYGIPFIIIYGPGAREGIVLPEILTPNRVIEALRQAR